HQWARPCRLIPNFPAGPTISLPNDESSGIGRSAFRSSRGSLRPSRSASPHPRGRAPMKSSRPWITCVFGGLFFSLYAVRPCFGQIDVATITGTYTAVAPPNIFDIPPGDLQLFSLSGGRTSATSPGSLGNLQVSSVLFTVIGGSQVSYMGDVDRPSF